MGLDFLILYEHVVREYESLLLLQAELQKRGYTAEIRQLLDRKKLRYFTYKKPKVVVGSCMYDNEAINSHVYNNVGVCQKVVNLHWEQMLSDTQEEEAWFNFNGNAKKCVHVCWGEETAKRLQAHGVDKKNTPVTGAVMMDFLRVQFSGYYLGKKELCEKYGLSPKKRLLLYISSFGYASMDEAEVRELSDMAGTDFTEFAHVNRESMAETLSWFDRYLSENPDVELVYRRHPSEWNSKELLSLEKKHKGFHVIFEDSVKQWITAADSIFIWMSSAVAEVYFANKGAVVVRPYPVPHQFDPVIYKNVQAVDTYQAFEKAANAQNSTFPIEDELIKAYFDHDDKAAYLKTADLLEDVYKNPPRDLPFSEGFTPRFNFLKYCALVGVHVMFALKLHPDKFKKISPSFASFAGRIYGYVEKAYLPKETIEKMRAKIERFLHA